MRLAPFIRIAYVPGMALVALCFASAWADTAATTTQETDRPNVVLLLSDDQGWTDYGFMGHDVIRTPNLDRLAKEGALYSRGYVPTPLCRPSLMSLVTGHYAKDHRVTGNDPSPRLAKPNTPEYVALAEELITNIDRFDTLPEILVRHGYLAYQSGKWWEGNYARGGFSHGMSEGSPGVGARHGDKGLRIGREGLEPIYDFIEEANDQHKPFYIWYAPFLPHEPHTPPERILRHYQGMGLEPEMAKYYAMCEWFDETCGELIDHLDAKGLRENTLIYFVCDNGWIQRTASTKVPEGWFTSFAPRSKQSVYDGGIRTPLIFSWPGRIKPGVREELVSSLDTFPTVLEAVGLEVPEGLPGLSLWSNVQAEKPLLRDTIFGESYAHDIADLNNPEASLLNLWCIAGRWKLILTYDGVLNRYKVVHARTVPIQLFDIVSDPHEKNNLADSHPETVEKLRQQIEAWHPLRERQLIRVE